MTTGRSLGKGVAEVGLSLSSYYVLDRVTPPVLPQVIFNYGVGERFDLGANLAFGILGVQSKYQIVGDQQSKFCMASGLSVNYFPGLESSDPDDELTIGGFSNINVPLHMSLHPSDGLAFYFSPKYSLITYHGDRIASESLIGFTPGIEFGKNKFRMVIEGTLFSPLSTGENFNAAFGTLSFGGKFRL